MRETCVASGLPCVTTLVNMLSTTPRQDGNVLPSLSHSPLSQTEGQCQDPWRPYDNKCYYISSDVKSWPDARSDCEMRGGDLMSISTVQERTWIRTQIGVSNIYWIGLNDVVSEGVWEWSDGSPFLEELQNWRPGQPDNWQDNEDCVQFAASDSARWNDEFCTVARNYICKRLTPNPPTQCDTANGWELFGSNCYKLKNEPHKSWFSARRDCVTEGGDLVSILKEDEEHYVISKMDASSFDVWIGFSTLSCTPFSCEVQPNNVNFLWSDGLSSSPSFTSWAADQPDLSFKETGICSAVVKDEGADYGKWKSHLCRHERPYMCKRGLNTICPPGWIGFDSHCYWVVSNPNLLTTWSEAQGECSRLGGNLLIINSQAEQYFINGFLPDLLQSEVPDIWIGLSDQDADGTFRWVDRKDITYQNWAVSHPHNVPHLWDCGQIYTGNVEGKWETANCFRNLGFVCEMAGGQNIQPTSKPDKHCDPGYLLFGDSCYHFESDFAKNWQDAKQQCLNDGGDLASIHSPETLSFLTAHMSGSSWVGLNDKQAEGTYVWSDGSPKDFEIIWSEGQPDNWEDNEDCVQLYGPDAWTPGFFNDQNCDYSYPFICKKGEGHGPRPTPPPGRPGWTQKCGYWDSDPFNDYCYLFQSLSLKTWADARRDCQNQGGDLVSITEPFEQAFIQAKISTVPTGVALWMGGHDSVSEGGWQWTDNSPFRYINWYTGNPDDYYGEDCTTVRIRDGYWNDDNCDFHRGYICKRRGNSPPPEDHPQEGYTTVHICQDTSATITCPHNSVIRIQAAMFGRQSSTICPLESGTSGSCLVENSLATVRQFCENRNHCFLLAHAEHDPCPEVSKYLEVVYSCEQNVCVRGLGMEDGNITNGHLSASSSSSNHGPDHARLNGNSCWMPSSAANSWIQVNLGEVKKVTGVVLQGCPTDDHWVKSYKVQISADGSTWTNYQDTEFTGNTDRNTAVTHLFGQPPVVQHIRILPQTHNIQLGLRMEILGCRANYTFTCGSIPAYSFVSDRTTLHCPAGCATQYYSVYGSHVYRGDSNICAAAIHAGVILNENGGECTMLKEAGLSHYSASTRNGITTKQYDGSYSHSFKFADGEMRCAGPDWYEFGDFCYKPFNDKQTWFSARQECRKIGAELVSILSQSEQSWIESYLYMATSDMWIGMNDLEMQNYFIWSDGQLVRFTYWDSGRPTNHNTYNKNCVEMLYKNGRWNDVSCSELNTYICKHSKDHYPAPSISPTVYGCQEGWEGYRYSCYWLEETPLTWSAAKTFCQSKSSTLLHILDIFEQSHFTYRLTEYSGFWWIGMRAKGNALGGVDYEWDNKAPVTFTHWDRDQPDNQEGSCVSMTSGPAGGFWDDQPCDSSFPFVCEAERNGISPPPPITTEAPSEGCANGWKSTNGLSHCYKFFLNDHSKKRNWQSARQDCLSRGAELVSIHSSGEQRFLSSGDVGRTAWIGLQNDPLSGGYQWSDGSPVGFTNWGSGEPNNHQGRENCVEMGIRSNYSYWNDLNCDAVKDWICEIRKGQAPIIPPVPPPDIPAIECGTNPGWRKNNGMCYYYNDTEITDLYTAALRCYEENARLASIADEEEQSFLTSMVGTGAVEYAWIGLKEMGVVGGEYHWLDFSPVTFVNWAPGEPNDANGEEQCVQMSRHAGTWYDMNCGKTSAGYVCKKYPGDSHTAPPPTQPWSGHCPQDWLLFGNKCFLFKGRHDGKDEFHANWTFAQTWCGDQGGDLAVIDNQYENDFVASYLEDIRAPVWIGLSDVLHEGKFTWSDGSQVLYTNWNAGEPNNFGDSGEHCTMIAHSHRETGRWNDGGCQSKLGFVCYRKKSNSIPPPPPTKSPCPHGYTSWKKNCYKLVAEPELQASWQDAQAACEKEKGSLASIDHSYEQNFVAGVVLQGRVDAWIGLRRQGDGSYTWVDGWPVFYTHWGPGEPTNHNEEGCVTMHSPPLFHCCTWNDTSCSQKQAYICKITSEKPPPTPAPGDGMCRQGWHTYGRYCYLVVSEKKGFSWPDSRHYCQMGSAELASIHSRAEVEFLVKLNYTRYHNLWIGLTKDSSYGWAWTDKSSFGFVNWAPGEPNEIFHPGGGAEKCVEMYVQDGKWNDNNCLEKRGFICRHRQYYQTDGNGGIIIPTDSPGSSTDAGLIAGILIGALLLCVIAGLSYYFFKVRGVKITNFKIDVPSFNNPNFNGASET
ncbi:macrophage mannose receptor 1-like [Acipenser ruthenus]|uniref:macrophage mannose receptor 1-like n=1 Tax=Acipenser ruthenus TaxID=7906 RepID=UPI0027425645|nr:macrophage mannose receptor 1-like [Acipenser ruthenus]